MVESLNQPPLFPLHTLLSLTLFPSLQDNTSLICCLFLTLPSTRPLPHHCSCWAFQEPISGLVWLPTAGCSLYCCWPPTPWSLPSFLEGTPSYLSNGSWSVCLGLLFLCLHCKCWRCLLSFSTAYNFFGWFHLYPWFQLLPNSDNASICSSG